MTKTRVNLKEIYTELMGSGRVELFIIPEIRFNNKKSDYLYLQYNEYFDDPELVFNKPGSHLNYILLQYKQKNTLIHHHWLDCQDGWNLFSISFKLICLMMYKKLGGRIVWTVHNKKPLHNRYKNFNHYIRKWMADNSDRLLVHCKSVIPEVSSYFNVSENNFRITHHPTFPAEIISRENALKKLNKEYDLDIKNNDQIFLMFGNINSQKRVREVCEIFSELPNNKRLIIAGPVKKGHLQYFREIKRFFGKQFNIIFLPIFIPEKNVPLFFNSVDCVVFNYEEILASGGVELAKCYKRPILAPKIGCLSELRGDNIFLFNKQDELKYQIETFT